jgi:TetR/AcrR family transcriptional regulator, transcriptional repressor for nem operon
MDGATPSILVPSFSDYLEARLADHPPPKKGLRTRARLVIAAVKMFDARGYHETRVADIAGSAGVAEGSFYIYFKDKAEVAVEILTEFFDAYATSIIGGVSVDDMPVFLRIQTGNRLWIALCRANPGVMNCSLQVRDIVPEIAKVASRTREIWYRGMVNRLGQRRDPPVDPDLMSFVTFMLAGIADDLIRKLLVVPDPSFLDLLERLGGGDEAIADAISLVWHQLLFGALPDETQISPMARRVAAILWRP